MGAGMKVSIFSVQDHYPDRARSLRAFYGEVLDQAVLAEELGYAGFFVAEHHFHPYGAVPDPAVFLTAIAGRTRTLRLGTAIAALPFHDPRDLAERYAMLDVLSGGRLDLGVGSGYLPHEFAGFGIDPDDKRARFEERLPVLEALLAGETVSHDGRFESFADVTLNVRPVQDPIPMWQAILRRESAAEVGRAGRRMMCVPYASLDSWAQLPDFVGAFHAGRREAGNPAGPDDLLMALHTFVAETDEAARQAAAAAFDLYVETRLYAKRAVYDDILERGLCLFGSVETVARKLDDLAAMGVGHVLALQNFGALAHADVCASMRRLAREAVPAMRGVSAQAALQRA